MNALKKAVVFSAGLLALAVCGPSAASTAADKAAIRTAGAAWDAAYHALDVEALVLLYADDAVLMPQTAPSAKGHAAIRKALLTHVAKLVEGSYTPTIANEVEIDVAGNLGFRSGTYSITDKSGATVDIGKWLEIWRKTNGKWRIIRDICNSDTLPLFPPDRPAVGGRPPST